MTRRTVVFVDENGKATPSYIELEDVRPTRCQWFVTCENQATGVTSHPTLGDIPTCGRCKAFADS